MSKKARKDICEEEREIESEKGVLREILREFRELIEEVRNLRHDLAVALRPKAFQITQINGGTDMSVGTIKGIPVGGVGIFMETDLPAGSADDAGAVRSWSSDD